MQRKTKDLIKTLYKVQLTSGGCIMAIQHFSQNIKRMAVKKG
jgi:hypothetical protein